MKISLNIDYSGSLAIFTVFNAVNSGLPTVKCSSDSFYGIISSHCRNYYKWGILSNFFLGKFVTILYKSYWVWYINFASCKLLQVFITYKTFLVGVQGIF